MDDIPQVFEILKAQSDIISRISQEVNFSLNHVYWFSAALSSLQELTYMLVEKSIPDARGMNNSYIVSDLGLMAFPSGDKTFIPSMYVTKQWEPKQTEILRRIVPQGGTFLDLGAHVGWHTFSVAMHVPDVNVISVEASEKNAKIFSLNKSLLGLENYRILLINNAAWNCEAMLNFEMPDSSNSGDSRVNDASTAVSGQVQGLRLDDLAVIRNSKIDVIKSDLQGVDQIAFEGLAETIERDRPVIIVEFWPQGILNSGSQPDKVLDFYEQLGYEIYDLDRNKFNREMIRTLLSDGTPNDTDLLLIPNS